MNALLVKLFGKEMGPTEWVLTIFIAAIIIFLLLNL